MHIGDGREGNERRREREEEEKGGVEGEGGRQHDDSSRNFGRILGIMYGVFVRNRFRIKTRLLYSEVTHLSLTLFYASK